MQFSVYSGAKKVFLKIKNRIVPEFHLTIPLNHISARNTCFAPYTSANKIPFTGISELQKKILTDLMVYFTDLTYITGEDEDIAKQIKTWIIKQHETHENIFNLLHSQRTIAPCASLLGIFHKFGIGTIPDINAAFEAYQIAADGGSYAGQSQVGYCYYYGLSVQQNDEKCHEYFQKSAAGGDIHGKINYAFCFADGVGRSVDKEMAFKMYRELADINSPLVLRPLADFYRNGWCVGIDENYAFELYKRSAEGGNCSSKNDLALSYIAGRGCVPDFCKAYYWFRMATENGFESGTFNLGYCYEKGFGVVKDFHEAIRMYISSFKTVQQRKSRENSFTALRTIFRIEQRA
ncbi:hypothetical protein G9A89_021740 [Geosiphon pyriformis]|nr:hypothetical protein G9A89_021740 [Geosiphon pyriformis]